MSEPKRASITLNSVKDPDGWGDLANALGLDDDTASRHFEFREYASLELVIEAAGGELKVVGGRVVPFRKPTPSPPS